MPHVFTNYYVVRPYAVLALGLLIGTMNIERLIGVRPLSAWQGAHRLLVNALAKVCVEELVQAVTTPVEVDQVNAAKEILILQRQTHLGQLTDKLREERVRRVIEPILAGGVLDDVPTDDRDYVIDLGLVRRANGGTLTIADPIYGEVIPRVLAGSAQDSLPAIYPSWLNADGSLNPNQLLAAFLAFWRQHGQPLLQSAPYHEVAPQLVMMAFLHRVVNGNGRIRAEYAIGSRRIDLCLYYGESQLAMELKVRRDGEPDPLPQGLAQLDHYLSGLGLENGWLVIFDQRSKQPDISQRTTTESATTPGGQAVTVIHGNEAEVPGHQTCSYSRMISHAPRSNQQPSQDAALLREVRIRSVRRITLLFGISVVAGFSLLAPPWPGEQGWPLLVLTAAWVAVCGIVSTGIK